MSRRVVLFTAAIVTGAFYGTHLSDGFVFQDEHLAFTVSPVVVHSISLALHLLNGLLLFAIARNADWPKPDWITALFWVHPLAVETVAYGAAQGELLILASLLLGLWCLQRRLWLALILPGLVLMTTKAAAVPRILSDSAVSDGVAMGVSYFQWWAWEATALWRLLGLWVLPVSLSVDHDTVHVSSLVQTLALVSLPVSAALIVWRWPFARLPILWMALALVPRFAIRVPLSILNEHHMYSLLPALSLLTVGAWTLWQPPFRS